MHLNYAKIRIPLMILFIAIAFVSVTVIGQYYIQDFEKQKQLDYLQGLVDKETPDSSSTDPTVSQPEVVEKTYHDLYLEKYAELIKVNDDFAGWLTVGDLEVPVVRGEDNDKYLTTDFYGNEDPYGTAFVDFRNDIDVLGDNTVIYAHNYDRTQQMFYEVERYKNIDFVNSNPIITFESAEKVHNYVVVAYMVTNTLPESGEVFDYHNRIYFNTEKEWQAYMDDVNERNWYQSEVPVDYYDRLITLSTCGYEFEDERYVVIARELRPNESVEDFASGDMYTATENPLMPEIWTKLYA